MVRTFPVHGWLLTGVALQVARQMYEAFPDADITSGRRSVVDQAYAMAENEKQRTGWIQDTYLDSPVKKACVKWCAENRRATQGETSRGLVAVLRTFGDADLRKLSKHLSGDAFDVQPNGNQKLKTWLREKAWAHGGRFLDSEGGLVRWHWQT